jgi:tetratricopeptide (TPR) repeat protein
MNATIELMPAPIAVAWQAFESEDRPFYKLHRLVDTYETLLKYLGILAIQNFYAAGMAGVFPKIDQQVRETIAVPTLGNWKYFLTDVLRCFKARRADVLCPELYLFCFKKFGQKTLQDQFSSASQKLLDLRNEYLGHGATLDNDKSGELIQDHTPYLYKLLEEAAFLQHLPLYYVEAEVHDGTFQAKPMMGAEYQRTSPVALPLKNLPGHHVIVHNPKTGKILDVHPLLVYLTCNETLATWDECRSRIIGNRVCQRDHVFFFNSFKRRLDFLEYAQGHHSRYHPPNPLPEEFHNHFPKPPPTKQRAEQFEQITAALTEYFVGRQEELQALDRFVKTSAKRVLVVVGAPGQGKSALLAKWTETLAKNLRSAGSEPSQGSARHFIRDGDAATYDTNHIFENLALQLSEQYQVKWKPLNTPETHEYRQAFMETLQAAADKADRPVLVVIDGLDEAERALKRQDRYGQTIVTWLPEPMLLPDNVRLILATRPELLDHRDFSAKFDRDKAERLELGKMTDNDVCALLSQVRSKYDVLDAPEYVEAIVERSEGSPLYLRMLLEDLSEGRITFGEIETLPKGVQAYFERILEYIEGEGRTREMPDIEPLLQAKRATLESLVEQGFLPQEQLEMQLERERAALQGKAGVKSVELLALFCLAKAPLTLKEAAAMLKADPPDVQRAFEVIRTVLVQSEREGEGCFTLFHAGFKEYVLNLGDYTDAKFHRHAETIADVNERLLVYCTGWRTHRSRYALRYYPDHLFETQRYDDLFAIAREAAFRQTQAQAFPDNPDLPLHTLQTALQGAADADNVVRMVEFLLAHARQGEALKQENPLGALRNGNLKRAWELADLFEIERCALWHLLLAWELKDTGRMEDARATLERLRAKELPRLSGWQGEYAAFLLVQVFEVSADILIVLQQRLLADDERRTLCALLSARGRFAAALAIARQIDEVGDRVKALGVIAAAQVQAGKFTAALETAQRIDAAEDRVEALRAIAQAQAQAWEFAAAVATAQQIDERRYRAGALRNIAQAQAQAWEFAAALATAQRIDEVGDRVEALQTIASAQAQAGEQDAARTTFAAACETAQQIDMAEDRAKALWAIARAQAMAGEFAAALATAQQIDERPYRAGALEAIAEAQAQAGEFAAALATAQRIDKAEDRAKALGAIAEAQAKVGEFAAALATAQQIDSAPDRESVLGAISEAQAKVEEFAAALENTQRIDQAIAKAQVQALDSVAALATAQRIDERRYRAGALRNIAQAQARAWEFAAALATAQRIDEVGDRVEALQTIASVQAQAGEQDAARTTFAAACETAQQIDMAEDRAKALWAIARAQAMAGEFAAALATAQQIEGAWNRAVTLQAIAWAQVQAGERDAARATFAAALETTQWIEEAWDRTVVLRDIAQAQAQAGEQDAARTTFAAACETAQRIDAAEDRAEALRDIASAQAQAGEQDAARETFAAAIATAIATAQRIDEAEKRARALRAIAEAQVQAGEQDAARATFVAAIATAQRIDETKDRATTLGVIVEVQMQAGEFGAALEIAQRIDEAEKRARALRAIAEAQVQVGEFGAALATTQRIERAEDRVGALRAIAQAQTHAGEWDALRETFAAALEIAQRIDVAEKRARALRAIAEAQAQAGEQDAARATFAAALETAQQIERAWDRVVVLRAIAQAQAQAGERDAARETFVAALETAQRIEETWDRVGALRDITQAQAQAGEFGAALATAQRIDEAGERAKALRDIAAVQAQAGEFADALATAQGIDAEKHRVVALRAIAAAQAQAGEFAAALETAQRIEWAGERANALRAIAVAHTLAGEFVAALEITQRIDKVGDRAWALWAIASAQAQAGEFGAALATAQQIDEAGYREWALQVIAKVQVQVGERDAARTTFAAACETAQRIDEEKDRAGALRAIAQAQAQAGERDAARETFTAALETAQRIDKAEERANALGAIAEAQAHAGFGGQAVRTAETILTDRNKHLPKIAAALAKVGDREHFKRLLIPCAYYLDAAYEMCGLLARLYPEQATAIANIVQQ